MRRTLWVVELEGSPVAQPDLPEEVLTGDRTTYLACQEEAARLRAGGAKALRTRSAALLPGGARGRRVDGGLQEGPERDGEVIVLFGRRPHLAGWAAAPESHPEEDLLRQVRHFVA